MKQLLLIGLTLLLLLSSLGHAFAAAFCPHTQGHECCFAKAALRGHSSQLSHKDMTMDGMAMDDMEMPSSQLIPDEDALANEVKQPVENCPHCMGHSGPFNTPASFVNVPDRSGRDVGRVSLPLSRLLARSAVTLAQNGTPRQHGPPAPQAPRHVLISVFLI
jgi:hypothetical protein